MNVKRYWISPNGIACEDNEGKFVRYEDYAALEARCAALAGEVYDLKHPGTYLPSKRETPATDAFLAEVRAQESKRVYESILDNPAVTDMESLVDWLEQNANDSVAFAAQLRKGVQS